MDFMVIDVREKEEYEQGHYEGALNIPPAELMSGSEQLKNIPLDKNIIVYCRTGSRSNAAMHLLKQLGYNHVVNGINKEHTEKLFSF